MKLMLTEMDQNAKFRRALAVHKKAARLAKSLNAMLSSRYYEVRIEALEALSDFTFALETAVLKGLHDRDDLVRVTAIEIAGAHRLKSMQGDIVRRLKSDRSVLVRSKAAVALGEMYTIEAVKILKDRIDRAGDAERTGLYYALIKLGEQKYLDPLLKDLTHNFYRIRCATASVIPGLVDKTNKRMLLNRLKEALKREHIVAARSSLKNALKELNDGARK